jgi:hypothetical protein
VTAMRSFIRAVRRLLFKRRKRIAREAKPYSLSKTETRPCDEFTGKPLQYSPEKGWRLLAHIGDSGIAAKIEQPPDLELNEELLERIDFLACLFSGMSIDK